MRYDLTTAVAAMKTPDDVPEGDQRWLTMAQQAYTDSTSWIDTSLRRQWEINLAMAQSRHPPGSKYYSDAYKHRSKGFRPKIRTAMRQHEAACAAAFFSSADLVSIEPGNPDDEVQQASAEVNQALLDYRLSAPGKHGVRWFVNLQGAYQNGLVQSVCISKQWWDFDESQGIDRPRIDLVPPENFRFDPAADWTDPVGTSPYLIHIQPMFAGDVVERSENPQSGWRSVELSEVLSHGTGDRTDSSTQRARDGRTRTDSHEVSEGGPFTTVWVREYVIRHQGRDMVFRTLGDTFLLSDPRPLEDEYQHGRPFVLGYVTLEAHKPYPQSFVEMHAPLAMEANELSNLRKDNVRLAMNRRYKIRRGANIDTRALLRNVPGGAIQMDNPETDVISEAIPDVTGSSYQEQDRINVDFDSLAGIFDTGSVQSNRQLENTVGGMNLLSSTTDNIKEYQLRVFTETWVEPVLQQLVKLEQMYETDETVLALAARRAEIWQRFGMDTVTDELLMQDVTVRVNVGMGATNPAKKAERIMMWANSMAQTPIAPRIDWEEVSMELSGAVGYRDGTRFLLPEEQVEQQQDPALMREQLRAQIEQAKLQLQQQMHAEEMQVRMMEAQSDLQEREIERQVAIIKYAADMQVRIEELQAKLGMELDKSKAKLAETTIRETGQNQRLAAEREAEMRGIGAGGGYLGPAPETNQ